MKNIGFRIWLLVIILGLSLLAIRPSFDSGVVVKSVDKDSLIFKEGLRNGEIIKSVNGKNIESVQDYSRVIGDIEIGNETRIDVVTDKNDYIIFTNETLQIVVDNVPRTNLKTGLDLSGGARALVQADVPISEKELQELIDVSRNRFNVFGLSDVSIRGVTDLQGNKFMLVEVAGATPDDLKDLVSKQGKFEAKIANETVFIGGEKDISSVCRNDASCAAITNCLSTQGGYSCNFQFSIYLSEEAAKRHADITREILLDPTGQYLTENLYLFVDDEEVDSLLISSGLKGQVTTQISISGSGVGGSQQEAFDDAQASMKQLQTILITGSLPYKLEIVKSDIISPVLGNQFIRAVIIAGVSALLLVSIIVFFRYRKISSSIALLFTAFSELLIILGVAALIRWNLDLPSIAGILATIGTGVDQQIVILDEAEIGKSVSISERMKRALFVIGTAYLTSVVALMPLYWAGAGLFRGFALTSIVGITAGVLITRPAFAEMIKRIKG